MAWSLSRLRGTSPSPEWIEAFLRASYLELPQMQAGEIAQASSNRAFISSHVLLHVQMHVCLIALHHTHHLILLLAVVK